MRLDTRANAPKQGPAVVTRASTFDPAWLGLVALLVAAVTLYLSAIDKPFFADDFLFLDQVRGRSLFEILAAPDPIGNFYRPVSRQLYFWAISKAAGQTPWAFHVVNLVLFLGALTLLFALARRLAGPRAGLVAVALVALHYCADVPVRWACGAQELLAVVGSLAALLLFVSGHRMWAALALLAAALSKETALVTPAIAVLLDRRPGERWRAAARRAVPLVAAIGVWAALWLAMPDRHSRIVDEVAIDPLRPLAALAHLGQVALGLEWRQGGLGQPPRSLPPLLPLALTLVPVLWRPKGGQRGKRPSAKGGSRTDSRPTVAGLLWGAIAAIPVTAVAGIWSAYYYLFAICGLALGLGSWLATRPRWLAALAVVLATVGSTSAGGLEEFATGRDPWSGQSHLNRFYIERANRHVERYLTSLERAHPILPPRSTVFYLGLASYTAFQTGDGPVLRWAYRDTSLRSQYAAAFTRARAARGPVFFMVVQGDTLVDKTRDPLFLRDLANSLMAVDEHAGAAEVLEFWREQDPGPRAIRDYWRAWTAVALGDSAAARQALGRLGLPYVRGGADTIAHARRVLEAGDVASAMAMAEAAVRRYPLEPAAHGLLADALLLRDPESGPGTIESYAAHVLGPRDPFAWRRWAMVQARHTFWREAATSLERYFALRGDRNDPEALGWLTTIRSWSPGSRAAQEGLRN